MTSDATESRTKRISARRLSPQVTWRAHTFVPRDSNPLPIASRSLSSNGSRGWTRTSICRVNSSSLFRLSYPEMWRRPEGRRLSVLVWSRRDRHTLRDRCASSRPCELSKSSALASIVLVPAAGIEPTFTASETAVLPLDDTGVSLLQWAWRESNSHRTLKRRLLDLRATSPWVAQESNLPRFG